MYDVTVGRRHYGKQGKIRHLSSFISLHPLLFLVPLVLVSSLFSGSYNFFAGRDATRSLVTGCFDPKDPKCTVDSHLLVDPTEKQLEEISMPSPSPLLPLSPSPPLPLSPSPPLLPFLLYLLRLQKRGRTSTKTTKSIFMLAQSKMTNYDVITTSQPHVRFMSIAE